MFVYLEDEILKNDDLRILIHFIDFFSRLYRSEEGVTRVIMSASLMITEAERGSVYHMTTKVERRRMIILRKKRLRIRRRIKRCDF